MTNNKPGIATMKAELEAAGYVFGIQFYTGTPMVTSPDGWEFLSRESEAIAIETAYAHMQQQRELARYRELGKQACDIPIGASIDQERIIDRMDEVYKLMTLPNITADNDDESDDDS